ncbi:MAG: PDC sensor domain-containing protein [Proteobacteria bacterium]|nr:PDC sensor domain-containing protein [Pseudomonadota bacterium]MBU1388183.1 PDC sensor domain-containing protein [Pseudomonadota bacterium]MBU1542995.1 PDC sensor domain-containing protein [Pseudomonadota bacterium]MBU2429685.1 PDC sensor domain-containing protein [Pseudomonadota bacterium]MBU2480482.1 PDC sensor domain-containing protein [Pseudomonadota bacterium]
MKKSVVFVLVIMFLTSISGQICAGEKAPPKVVALANSELVKIGTDPVIIDAVKAQNAKNMTLDQIKNMDASWKAHVGIADYMKAMMESECAMFLYKIQKSQPYYVEIFVMDSQGANVAMTDKTSDYWQGDEAKFQKSFADGTGAVFIDEVEYDDSSQAYLVQVSVPVKDGDKVIGAITFGIDIDSLE